MNRPLVESVRSEELGMRFHLFSTFASLMETRPFDAISTKALCESANVSRQTFYNYFTDKYAMLEWYFDYVFSQSPSKIGRSLSWYEGILAMAQAGYENRQFTENIGTGNDEIRRMVTQRWKETLVDTLVNYKHELLTEELMYQIDVFSRFFVNEFGKWKMDMDSMPPEKFARLADGVVPHLLHETLCAGM